MCFDRKYSRLTAAAAFAALMLAPIVTHADDHQSRKAHAAVQKNKNNMRNLAIGGAAVAGYGLLNHNSTATVLGVAGAALAGSQYENARKEQSKASAARNRRHRYHRSHH
ncbi:MAG: hypothetical protein ACRYFS_05890 [Janthinobacterium lividum]